MSISNTLTVKDLKDLFRNLKSLSDTSKIRLFVAGK
jgi:hypothetical protein